MERREKEGNEGMSRKRRKWRGQEKEATGGK